MAGRLKLAVMVAILGALMVLIVYLIFQRQLQGSVSQGTNK